MSTPTTNYFVLSPYSGLYNDLGQLFTQRSTTDSSANLTGFQYLDPSSNKQTDINNLFYPLSSGLQLSYKTNMTALNGKDLNSVFQANPFIVTGPYTLGYDTSNNYYTLVFADYLSSNPQANPSNIGNGSAAATLTFIADVTSVYFTLVGGGGGGGAPASTYPGIPSNGGGGGAGGSITSTSLSSISNNTVCNITVGEGGTTGTGGASTVTIQSTTTTTLTAAGGNRGYDAATYGGAGGSSTTSGSGGAGGTYIGSTNARSGGVGALTKINSTDEYYFGGGGGGGSYVGQSSSSSGGLGGGGGGGNGLLGNNNLNYVGPNLILYPRGSFQSQGWPATGGGSPGNRQAGALRNSDMLLPVSINHNKNILYNFLLCELNHVVNT